LCVCVYMWGFAMPHNNSNALQAGARPLRVLLYATPCQGSSCPARSPL
jgi:hypothetical protein